MRKMYSEGQLIDLINEYAPGGEGKQDKLTAGTGIILDDVSATIAVDGTVVQGKLTAGENITIEDNVISASGGGGGTTVSLEVPSVLAGSVTINEELNNKAYFIDSSVQSENISLYATDFEEGVVKHCQLIIPTNAEATDGRKDITMTVGTDSDLVTWYVLYISSQSSNTTAGSTTGNNYFFDLDRFPIQNSANIIIDIDYFEHPVSQKDYYNVTAKVCMGVH